MKKYLPLVSLLLILSLSSVSQSKPTEEKVKKMLCHKWKAVSMETHGKKELADEVLYITFLKDGTFIESEEGTEPSEEKWSYKHETMTLTTGDIPKRTET